MIKAFLFDYDGVITAGVKDGIPATRLARNLNVPYDKATEWIVRIWDGFSTGKLSEEEAWKAIEGWYGKQITAEQRDIWYMWEELKPLPKMVDLVQKLKSKGFPVGVASNVLPVTAQVIRENGGYDGFDFLVLSYQAGARKPDPRIYETAMANLEGIAAADILFLDDREQCTEAAAALGMKTVHVINHDKAIDEVLGLAGIE